MFFIFSGFVRHVFAWQSSSYFAVKTFEHIVVDTIGRAKVCSCATAVDSGNAMLQQCIQSIVHITMYVAVH